MWPPSSFPYLRFLSLPFTFVFFEVELTRHPFFRSVLRHVSFLPLPLRVLMMTTDHLFDREFCSNPPGRFFCLLSYDIHTATDYSFVIRPWFSFCLSSVLPPFFPVLRSLCPGLTVQSVKRSESQRQTVYL